MTPPPCRADHTRKKLPIILKANHERTRMDTNTDGAPLVGRRQGMKPTRERGRPARTILGTASAISSTWLDRQWSQDSASAETMPFPPAGCPGGASQGNRAAPNGSACGRDARAPGWGLPDGAVVGLSSQRLLRKPTNSLWQAPDCPRACPPPSPEKILCIDVNRKFARACL